MTTMHLSLAICIIVAVSSKSLALASVPAVKVAVITATSGADPNTALELNRGAEVFTSLNQQSAKRLALTKFDNKGDIKETVSIIERIAAEGFTAAVGIARSDEAIAAGQISKSKNLLFMTPFATNPKLSQLDAKVIQVCYSDDYQGKALAELASKTLRPKKLLILVNSESLYSTGLAERFLASFPTSAAVLIKRVDYTERDLKQPEIEKIAQSMNADLIFIPDHITRAALFAKALNKKLPKVRFLGGDGFGGKKILTGVFGDTPKIDLYYTTHWNAEIDTAENRRFIKEYRRMFPDSEPNSGAAMMFDLLNILDSAVLNGNFEPTKIAAYIRSNKFNTTTGKLNFPNEVGSGPVKPVVVLHLKDSQYGFYKTIR
ncbi:MAG: hypothetical protein EOP06_06415 [Proteobacteria bacterium]|nr:MAG: hypothetical protein EOP06_06415 [Pseudomonadota bacterium]